MLFCNCRLGGMASHLNCHEAQPQPSMYPPALPLTREHGAISEYNYWGHAMVGPFHHSPQGMFGEYKMLDNLQSEDGLADYVSNDFGGLQLNNQISIQGNEDDLFPTPKPPTPTVKWTLPTKLQPDPDLMITPEKRPPNLKQPNKNIDKEKLKVHFDENVQTRICSPDETNDESISNESNDNKQSLPYNYRVFRHSAEYNGIAAQGGGSMFSNSGIGVTHGGDHTRNFETQTEKILERVHQPPTSNQGTQKIVQSSIQESKPSSVKAGSEPTKQDDKKIKSVQKGFKPLLRHTKFTSKKPVHKTETVAESEFARPEFHSTLRVGAELKELQQRGVDAKAVVKQKLKVSESLNAKVVEKVRNMKNTVTVRLF